MPIKLTIKGDKKAAQRAGSRRGIALKNCQTSSTKGHVVCEAPCKAFTKVAHWHFEPGTRTRDGMTLAHGQLARYSEGACGAGELRGPAKLSKSEYKKLATATSIARIEKYINEYAASTDYRVDPTTLKVTNATKAPPGSWFVMRQRGGYLFGRKSGLGSVRADSPALTKKIRYKGRIMTKAEYVEALVGDGYRLEEKYISATMFDRTKFNRMDYSEQAAYQKKLDDKKKTFVAVDESGSYFPLTKTLAEYFGVVARRR